jgi:hypothetical protein
MLSNLPWLALGGSVVSLVYAEWCLWRVRRSLKRRCE